VCLVTLCLGACAAAPEAYAFSEPDAVFYGTASIDGQAAVVRPLGTMVLLVRITDAPTPRRCRWAPWS